MVSFGGSEDEILNDSVSLAASDGEELSGLMWGGMVPRATAPLLSSTEVPLSPAD